MLLSSTIQHRDTAGNLRNLAVLTVETLSERVHLDLVSPGSRTFLSGPEWELARAVLIDTQRELVAVAGSATTVMKILRERSRPSDGFVLFTPPSYGNEPDIAVWRDQLRITTLGRRRVVVFLDIDGVLATDASYVPWTADGRPKDKHRCSKW